MFDRAAESIQELREVLGSANDINVSDLTTTDFQILANILDLQTSLDSENLDMISESVQRLKTSQIDAGTISSTALSKLAHQLAAPVSQFIQRTTAIQEEEKKLAIDSKNIDSASSDPSLQQSRSSSLIGTLFSRTNSFIASQQIRGLDSETREKFSGAVSKRLSEIDSKIARIHTEGTSQAPMIFLVKARSLLNDYKISSQANEDFTKLITSIKSMKKEIESQNTRAVGKEEKVQSDKLTKLFETIAKYEKKSQLIPKISGPVLISRP